MQLNNLLFTDHIWCVIPVYNNKDTIKDIALECRSLLKNVVVVDDGSTDEDIVQLLSDTDIIVLRHDKNKGKGRAILTALSYIKEQGGSYIITIDADGQHSPKDILKFIPLLENTESSIIIGCRNFDNGYVPRKSRIGRAIANFWLRIETGVSVNDCQSGFRCYPVKYLSRIPLSGAGYDFETEVLAKAVWSGMQLKMVKVDVWYPELHKKISSFRPFMDNLRISLMHTRLVGRRLMPLPYKKLVLSPEKHFEINMLRHPVKIIKELLSESTTPVDLAVSAGVGILLAVLPLLSIHTLVIIYVTTRLHLNKVMAVSIQHLCMPPFVPVACAELGHYMLYGRWLTDVSLHTIFGQLNQRIFEWLLGSLIVAPVMAVVVGTIVYFIAKHVQKRDAAYAGS